MLIKTTQAPKANTKLLYKINWVLGLLALSHFVWKWGNNDWTTDLLILFTLSDSFVFFASFGAFAYIQPFLSPKETAWIYTLTFTLLLLVLLGTTLLNSEYGLAFLTSVSWLFPVSILAFGLHVAKQRKADNAPDNTNFATEHTN